LAASDLTTSEFISVVLNLQQQQQPQEVFQIFLFFFFFLDVDFIIPSPNAKVFTYSPINISTWYQPQENKIKMVVV
jgi:hypothetical protein